MAAGTSQPSPDSLAAHLLAVLPRARVTRFSVGRGAAVFREGDPAASVFVVEAGQVRLVRILADGTPLILYVAGPGETFAEASLSAVHYHCAAIAEIDAVVLAVPKDDLLAALAADPARCLALASVLAAQVRDLRARLELRNIRAAAERILAWLRVQASGDPPRMLIRRPWTEVADELGLTREAVYRGLATLEQQGRIRRDHGTVRLSMTMEETPAKPPRRSK